MNGHPPGRGGGEGDRRAPAEVVQEKNAGTTVGMSRASVSIRVSEMGWDLETIVNRLLGLDAGPVPVRSVLAEEVVIVDGGNMMALVLPSGQGWRAYTDGEAATAPTVRGAYELARAQVVASQVGRYASGRVARAGEALDTARLGAKGGGGR